MRDSISVKKIVVDKSNLNGHGVFRGDKDHLGAVAVSVDKIGPLDFMILYIPLLFDEKLATLFYTTT